MFVADFRGSSSLRVFHPSWESGRLLVATAGSASRFWPRRAPGVIWGLTRGPRLRPSRAAEQSRREVFCYGGRRQALGHSINGLSTKNRSWEQDRDIRGPTRGRRSPPGRGALKALPPDIPIGNNVMYAWRPRHISMRGRRAPQRHICMIPAR